MRSLQGTRVRRTILKEPNPVEGIDLFDQINPVGLVRRTRARREAQKLMKMMQKTGGKGLPKMFG